MMRWRRGGQGGFSLAEMLAVVAIAGIVLLVAIPGLSGWLRSNRVRSSANNLVTHIRLVRHAAIARSLNASMDLDVGGSAYEYETTTGETLSLTLPEGVTITSASPDPLTFRPNGSLDGANSASVQVQGGVTDSMAHRYTISVSKVGVVSVVKEEVSL